MTEWSSDEDLISEMIKSEELEKRDPVISKVPLLKHSRDKFIPEIIRKMGAMELDEAIDLALAAGTVEAAAQGKILQATLLSARGEDAEAESLLDEVRDLGPEFLVSLPNQ